MTTTPDDTADMPTTPDDQVDSFIATDDELENEATLQRRELLVAQLNAKCDQVVATIALAIKIEQNPAYIRNAAQDFGISASYMFPVKAMEHALAEEVLRERDEILSSPAYPPLDGYCEQTTGNTLEEEAYELAQGTTFLDALHRLIGAQRKTHEIIGEAAEAAQSQQKQQGEEV